jgi:hypothetical protein
LLLLLAGNLDTSGIRHNYIVTTVHCIVKALIEHKIRRTERFKLTTGVVYWLVLAHEHESDSFRQLSKDTVRGIDVVPYPSVC